jgi:menaquinone-9 beta-reductase
MYWKLTPDETQRLTNTVRILLFNGGYAGLELVEDGLANLCLLVTKRRFAALNKQWIALLVAIQSEVPSLARCLEGALPCWEQPMAIFGIPYGYVNDGSAAIKNMYRLGDQMAVIPSFCGDGMAIALHTGVVAAENMLQGQLTYHENIRSELLPQIRRATYLSILMSTNIGKNMLFLICRIFPKILSYAAMNTRLARFTKYTTKPI